MLDRRSFLLGMGLMALAPLVTGCSDNQTPDLLVRLLSKSVSPSTIEEFRAKGARGRKIKFDLETQLQDLFNRLQQWQKPAPPREQWRVWEQSSPPVPHLTSLGDTWLEKAIQNQLIQPLDLTKVPSWSRLPPPFSLVVKRDRLGRIDEEGQIWGAPYRWGLTLMVYHRPQFEKLGWLPRDWGDLWHPDLQGRISLMDQPREAIGLTLKKLGYSYNTPNLEIIPQLKEELTTLAQQIKFYSSTEYLQPLVLKDTWLAVGWSSDILPILARYPELEAIVPPAGTAIWSDVWVRPAKAENSELIEAWIDFFWQDKAAKQIALYTNAASPILTAPNYTQWGQNIKHQSLLFPEAKLLAKCEFLDPLSPKTIVSYDRLWRTMRGV